MYAVNRGWFFPVRLAVENTGLGPAVLQNFIYYQDEEKVYDSEASNEPYCALYSEIDRALEPLSFWYKLGAHSRTAGEMLEAGEEHLLMEIEVPDLDTLDQ